jgi:serine/threonine protein kinase
MNGSSSGSISDSGDRGTQQQQQPTQQPQPQPLHHHQGQHRPINSCSSSSSVNINHPHSAVASVTSKENEEVVEQSHSIIEMDEHENENDEQRHQHQQLTEQTPRRAPQEHAAALEEEATTAAAAATAELAATTTSAASGMRNNTISRPIHQQQQQQDGDEAESSHTDDENENDDENDHPEEEKQPMQQHQQQQQQEPAQQQQQQHRVQQQQRRERQQRQRQRQHPLALGNPNKSHYRQCPVCGRFPYRCPDMLFPLALPEGGGGGADPDDFVGEGGAFEAGIYEFLYRLNPTAFEEDRANAGGGGEFGYNDHGEFGYYHHHHHHPTPSSRTVGGCPPLPLSWRLNTETAQRCMERCERHVQRLQVELARAGLLHSENQSYICGDNLRSARMIAPFDYDELSLGPMLGTGGFSTVYEISSFLPKTTTTMNTADPTTTAPPPLNTFQIAARDFLTKHAQRQVDDVTDISVFIGGGGGGASSALHVDAKKKRRSTISTIASAKDRHVSSSKRLSGCVANSVPTTARYAIKHLRRGLLKDPDRFERAAIDLALEAQLLVAMDHENIMSLRGWARSGPKSYVNGQGKNTDYFLILDKLPETLDDVIYKWRKQLKKYKTKLSRPWIFDKAKFVTKLDTLLLHRLHAAQDVAAALEYMHDRRIINRDVKSANIGFDVRGDLKLFDFGLSRLLPSDRPPDAPEGYVMSRVGTKYYMAPESTYKIVIYHTTSSSSCSSIVVVFAFIVPPMATCSHEFNVSLDLSRCLVCLCV